LPGVVLLEHRRQGLALEADRDVRVVFEEDEVVLPRELEQARALFRAQRVARGVLEVGDDVRERGLRPSVQRGFQRVEVDAVGLQGDGPHVGRAASEVQQRAVVCGRLHEHEIARLDDRLEEERVRLHRAVGDQDLLRADAVALGDPLAQRDVADRRAVGRGAGGIGVERLLGGFAQAVDVHDVERRRAPGEGDRVGHAPKASDGWAASRPPPADHHG
jgi:hypothetical protein